MERTEYEIRLMELRQDVREKLKNLKRSSCVSLSEFEYLNLLLKNINVRLCSYRKLALRA